MAVITKEVVRVHIGKWVECHSIYGVHHGILHRALHDGIILTHVTNLASHDGESTKDAFAAGSYRPDVDEADIEPVQFFPFPGMFVPYAGLYGFRPFGFII